MHSSAKRVYFDDFVFVVDENVYQPAEDTFLFAENLAVDSCDCVLDMGTGCGILGILAAKNAYDVLAVDVNPYAVRCAKENAVLNDACDNITFVQGDLFTWLSLKATFEVILFNAPYLLVDESEADSWLGRAWAGGATGRQVIDRFIIAAPSHLKWTGRILLMQSTLTNVNKTLQSFSECRLTAEVVAECVLPFFETVVLIEARF